MVYTIEYSPEAFEHLHGLTARERQIVVDTIRRQLTHQPALATRNRKRPRENPLATWELRIGNFRVYYDLDDDPAPAVQIRAIGIKDRTRVWIAGNEYRP